MSLLSTLITVLGSCWASGATKDTNRCILYNCVWTRHDSIKSVNTFCFNQATISIFLEYLQTIFLVYISSPTFLLSQSRTALSSLWIIFLLSSIFFGNLFSSRFHNLSTFHHSLSLSDPASIEHIFEEISFQRCRIPDARRSTPKHGHGRGSD